MIPLAFSFFRVLPILVVVACLLLSNCPHTMATTSVSCRPDERRALLFFKHHLIAVADPGYRHAYSYWFSSWADPSGNSTRKTSSRDDDCCKWKGVTCHDDDHQQDFVTGIDLNNCDSDGDPVEATLDGPMKAEAVRALAALSRLSHFDLGCHYLNGSIPEEIGNLTSLRYLNLTRNDFSGFVPSSLGNLILLQHLDLSSNSLLQHSFPSEGDLSPLFQLQTLDLSSCNFSGSFPSWLRNQTNLSRLSLARNAFSGEIPTWAWRLASHSLDFSSNHFSHTFTCDDAYVHPSLPSLVYLDASGNGGISGTFPCFISNLTSLQTLHFGRNSLTGPIPDHLFTNTLSLTDVDLSYNHLQGGIPPSLLRLPSLSSLDLTSNNFTGPIPDVLMNLTRLYLSHNKLEGLLPPSIQCPNSLESLDLSNNQFDPQTIPSLLLQLPSLYYLNLSSNKFTGPIPDVFRDGMNLRILDLSYNLLSGLLPPSMQSLWRLDELQLQNNRFLPQEIPASLFSPPSLYYLDLSFNNFTGIQQDPSFCNPYNSAPNMLMYVNLAFNKITSFLDAAASCLLSFQYLVALDVSNNQLRGPIPSFIQFLENIRVLDLSSNELNGTIPEWIGSELHWLQVLVLSRNSLTGILPPTLGLLSSMQTHDYESTLERQNVRIIISDDGLGFFSISINLKGQMRTIQHTKFFCFLDLSANRLSGPIPKELGKLKGLQSLNISGNSLEGEIPRTLGDMKELESLDLSRNMLEGHIPDSFKNLQRLEVLNLSSNHLSGSIPSSPQWLDTFDEKSFLDNDGLCVPNPTALARLPPCNTNSSSRELAGHSSSTMDSGESEVEWSGFVVGYSVGLLLGTLFFNLFASRIALLALIFSF